MWGIMKMLMGNLANSSYEEYNIGAELEGGNVVKVGIFRGQPEYLPERR